MDLLWKIAAFNSGENDEYEVVIISSFTLACPVHCSSHSRGRGRTGCVPYKKEKNYRGTEKSRAVVHWLSAF
jgi:hypothetical protein